MRQCLRLVPLCTVLALILTGSLLFAACSGGAEPTLPPESTTTATATATPETVPTRQPGPTPPEERVIPTPTVIPPPAMTSRESDREALVALYNATDGPNWLDNGNWLSDAPVGEWTGVKTDDDGRVIGLDLYENQLSGEIPPELGNLANLEVLYLDGNDWSGEIPAELGDLANLVELYLDGNDLSGCVPAGLQDQLNLDFSHLDDLPFCTGSDTAPSPGMDRGALIVLYNATEGPGWSNNGNWLSDAPVGEWDGVTTDNNGRVILLDFWRNNMSGEIPAELGNLASLEALDLFGNQLSGEIPPELGNLASLTYLNLKGNKLSGCVPAGLQDQLIMNLSDLGGLPFCTGSATAPTPGTDREALIALYHATDGPNWRNNTNWLSDAPVSEWHGVITDNSGGVIELILRGNQLSGEIPAELGNLTNLEGLELAENELSGEIPPELSSLSNLRALFLGTNQLSGEIPPEVGSLANLWGLFLDGTVERGDTGGVGQPHQPDRTDPRREPVELGNTGGVGQPHQPGIAGPRREPVERGDTAGVEQPH